MHTMRRNVLTMVNPSLSTIAHRCCEPRKGPLKNSSGSWLIFSTSTPNSAVGTCVKKLRQRLVEALENRSSPHTHPSGTTKRRRRPPGLEHCSTQPPARAFVLPSRSPDSTRLAWPRGLDNLFQPRKRRPQPIYCLQKLHELIHRLQMAHPRQSAQTLPVVRHLSSSVHLSTPRDMGIEEKTFVSRGKF